MAKETNNIFEAINSSRKKYLGEKEAQEIVILEREKAIAESVNAIKLAYEERLKQGQRNIANSEKELNSYGELLQKYSTFNSELIGRALEKIVSMIEGEEYLYQQSVQDTTKRESTVFGSETFPVKYNVKMIVSRTQGRSYYRDFEEYRDSICDLIESGKAILLEKKEGYPNKNIQFYRNYYGNLESLVNFGRFDYIKNFIDRLIQYRFQNCLEKISEDEIQSFMNEFISDSKDLIEHNYQLRMKEKRERLEQELKEKQEEYSKQIDQIKLEELLKNGVTSVYTTKLIDRLQESIATDGEFNKLINQFIISYEGQKSIATLSYEEPFVSTENIVIAKVNIKSSIKNYFDDSDQDPHLHGFVDINLVDDGLVAIVDISNTDKIDSCSLSNCGLSCPFDSELCKVDKIDDHVRILFLPNKGKYRHKPVDYYGWIVETIASEIKDGKRNESKQGNDPSVSYKMKWDYVEVAKKMLVYAKEIELVSYLNANQLNLYKQKTMIKK